MYNSNYIDGGDRITCRNSTFYIIWLTVLCKVIYIGGFLFKRTNRLSRE